MGLETRRADYYIKCPFQRPGVVHRTEILAYLVLLPLGPTAAPTNGQSKVISCMISKVTAALEPHIP